MTRRNPERPPGPSYYRLPEASWTMIRDEYLSGWTAKEIAEKWRVSPTSVYRHACNNGWTKAERGQAFHDQIVAEAEDRAAAPKAPPEPAGETWTSWKETPPESLREGRALCRASGTIPSAYGRRRRGMARCRRIWFRRRRRPRRPPLRRGRSPRRRPNGCGGGRAGHRRRRPCGGRGAL